MDSQFTWKKFQFISEVQTALIHNAINRSLEVDILDHREKISGTGCLIRMHDAFHAAEQIPPNLSAHEAACQFYNFAANGEPCPVWALRP